MPPPLTSPCSTSQPEGMSTDTMGGGALAGDSSCEQQEGKRCTCVSDVALGHVMGSMVDDDGMQWLLGWAECVEMAPLEAVTQH
jgi:hypothetical protein